jgi:molybdate transport system substrate-binding protein
MADDHSKRATPAPTARTFLATALLAVFLPCLARADELRIAVASNFAQPMTALVSYFESNTAHQVVLSSNSTGKHYAQIRQGAPFDVFLAADRERPERLEQDGLAIPGTRFTYALGRLVLWSPREGYVDKNGTVLRAGDFRHLAIANPKLAPYGRAAREVLTARKLWTSLQPRIVRGENVGQAYQYVHSGNAELGFVAASQLRAGNGSRWTVPADRHAPIEQQAVLLRDRGPARAFLAFLRSEAALKIIRGYGYDVP